jgi:amidase
MHSTVTTQRPEFGKRLWRRARLAAVVVLTGGGATMTAAAEFRFAGATIEALQSRMAAGEFTARELTAAYLERIAAIDRAGPKLNAVIELNPEALEIAAQLDAERQAGRVRGPLHGVPVLVKDNIATADRMETTAGSLALVGRKPMRDAHVVARLRAAGAVLLGKTNLSEWANFRGERSVSGWSGRGGQTLNPHVLDRSPSGSSSGSAVAVAADLCVVAIGTETNGSIVSPASTCGIVGLKPTVGRVSRTGIIPIAESFDTAGPMTRTVRDAALVLAAIAGTDEADPATRAGAAHLWRDGEPRLRAEALRGARIGALAPAGYWPSVDDVWRRALDVLRAAGADVVEVALLPRLPVSTMLEVYRYEMKHGVNAYLATTSGPEGGVRTLAEVIAFNERHWARELPLFGQQHLVAMQAKGPLTEPAYLRAREECWRASRADGIDAVLTQHRIVALVTVTRAVADLIAANEVGENFFAAKRPGGGSSTAAAMAGYPSVTVPAGAIEGLPVGLSFFGAAWSEAELLGLAADFEARAVARPVPQFRPTLGTR